MFVCSCQLWQIGSELPKEGENMKTSRLECQGWAVNNPLKFQVTKALRGLDFEQVELCQKTVFCFCVSFLARQAWRLCCGLHAVAVSMVEGCRRSCQRPEDCKILQRVQVSWEIKLVCNYLVKRSRPQTRGHQNTSMVASNYQDKSGIFTCIMPF